MCRVERSGCLRRASEGTPLSCRLWTPSSWPTPPSTARARLCRGESPSARPCRRAHTDWAASRWHNTAVGVSHLPGSYLLSSSPWPLRAVKHSNRLWLVDSITCTAHAKTAEGSSIEHPGGCRLDARTPGTRSVYTSLTVMACAAGRAWPRTSTAPLPGTSQAGMARLCSRRPRRAPSRDARWPMGERR